MPLAVHAATACFPGIDVHDAVARIHAGIAEPLLGTIRADHIQLCPQSSGHLDEGVCETLRERYPDTAFRLHANPASGRACACATRRP